MIDQFPDTKKMVQPTDRQIDRLFWQCEQNPQEYRELIRKFLARFGIAAIEPVPVGERMPGPEDCTTNPRTGQGQWCWGWVQHDDPPYSGRWRMMRKEWLADEAVAWLPHHALPVPQQEAE
jgi:hypothetical protein